MQKFVVQGSFWDLFPDSTLGVIVAHDLKPATEVSEADRTELADLLAKANDKAATWCPLDPVSKNEVVAVWREAYKLFKTKRGARCSIENLLKRASKGNPVGTITPSVDIYNILSLTYALPFGGEDISSFVGDLRLGVVDEEKAFRPLGEQDDPALPGELCYYDGAGAVCRCWNWRDGQRTALTDTTRDAFLITECVDAARAEDARRATDEFASMMERYLGATIAQKSMVTRESPEVALA